MAAAKNIEYRGRIQSLRAWARELGMRESTLRYRLARGQTVARALSKPVHPRFKRLHTPRV